MRLFGIHVGAETTALFAAILLCVIFVGCGNYCLVVQTNPGGTINTNTSCQTSTTGNVALAFGAPLDSGGTPYSTIVPVRSPHIFVTLSGVDALPAPVPGEEGPAWQPLAPQLALRPVQVDLNARAGDSCATGPLGAAAVPAGVYRELRLRVVPDLDPSAPADQVAPTSSPLAESACGANLLNCLIPPDAAAQPLTWNDSDEVVISSDRIAGGFIRVLPDSDLQLTITFNPASSVALPAADGIRLIPSFSASTQFTCDSDEAAKP